MKSGIPFIFGNRNTTTGDIVGVNITSDGRMVVVFYGDSNMAGRGEVPGPTPATGTAFYWDNTSVVNLGSADVPVAVNGSMCPQFCIDMYNKTGKRVIVVNIANGGSNFYPDGDTNNWYSTGTLPVTGQNKVKNCLTAIGLVEPRYIVRRLGINDARASQVALSDVQLGINYTQSWVRAQFGNRVPLLTCNIGREGSGVTQRVLSVRSMIENEAMSFPRTYVAIRDENYLQYYKIDNLHLNQTGLNLSATETVNYILNNQL